MKRALIALVAVGFVVAAISIARANSGDDEPTKASIDVSRKLDRDVTKEQTTQPAEQVLKAQADLAAKVAEDARTRGRQSIIVSLREVDPGDVWTITSVAGKSTCGIHDENVTYVEVTAGQTGPLLASEVAPAEATLLSSGACEGTLEIFVPDASQYRITIGGAAKREFEPVDVLNSDRPVKVTIVG